MLSLIIKHSVPCCCWSWALSFYWICVHFNLQPICIFGSDITPNCCKRCPAGCSLVVICMEHKKDRRLARNAWPHVSNYNTFGVVKLRFVLYSVPALNPVASNPFESYCFVSYSVTALNLVVSNPYFEDSNSVVTLTVQYNLQSIVVQSCVWAPVWSECDCKGL